MTQHYLATPLRRALEKTIKEARTVAEAGAAEAIRRLGVADGKAPSYLSEDEKELRRRLRAHARALGDGLDKASDEQEVKRLVEASAYAHWHRMLFARFLAERGLLRHPEHNVPVTLEDCREIAAEEGAADGWAVAERYAASMLPAVFRIDDPVLSVAIDAAQSQTLHRLVTNLDEDVFQAEDSLGWTYQFWRAAEKDAVNKKGGKIGADEISAVTQLFTEPYMVRFLLHNTLGAWWAGKVLASNPDLAMAAADEDVLRRACSLPDYSFDMLRFVREGEDHSARWRPAAGTFSGWPSEARAITVLDPCCGSGHFLTEALAILVALRKAEEGTATSAAVAAVLQQNLYGLEIDGRCVQIAAFAVALTGWRLGNWQNLPLPHIAWVGAPPPVPRAEFVSLANGNGDLREGLDKLFDVFAQAPLLGSLIEPTRGDLMSPQRLGQIEPLLDLLLEKARSAEPERKEGTVAASGMADAAKVLGSRYTLVVTNVPFLGRGKQAAGLADYIGATDAHAKADLATAMIGRIMRMLDPGGVAATVSPQNWWFLGSYTEFRRRLLQQNQLVFIASLGEEAWQEFGNRGPLASLVATTPGRKVSDRHFGIDAIPSPTIDMKIDSLKNDDIHFILQDSQLKNPDSRILSRPLASGPLLETVAHCYEGLTTGDIDRAVRKFWELQDLSSWKYINGTPVDGQLYSGRESVVIWGESGELLLSNPSAVMKGREAIGKRGVRISQMRSLSAGIYEGELVDKNAGTIIPNNPQNFPAIFAYCSSKEYREEVRKLDKSVCVTVATLAKVPFNLMHWQKVAAEEYPDGLPEPFSDDATQWLFHGHPAHCQKGNPLHVALGRIVGYRWPAETDETMRLSAKARELKAHGSALPSSDQDGLLAVAGVAGEKPLADRLRTYLAAAFGAEWSDVVERRLVAEADEVFDKKQAKDNSLEAWLRDRAFRQHCTLFHQRPFLWHIWDGLKDGFSVFVHYHRLTQANLRKLTYTMLGDWLARAKAENNDLRYEKGRELQQKLEKVLEGEAPYDIFVRWKPLAEQPAGWDPDLDDGVRMNIRPFVEAGILREQPKGIKWTKDRGNDVPSAPWYPVFNGERINDHHTTLEEKRAARGAATARVAAT